MSIILLTVSALYAIFTTTLYVTWLRMPRFQPTASPAGEWPFVTVVVPVRNEAASLPALLDDLNRQTYAHFEVIIADDASTDDTLSIAQTYPARFKLTALPLPDAHVASPKKRAITSSIAIAAGTLIVTTDGDCRVGPRWLEMIARFYAQTGAKLISGPVTFTPETSVFAYLQTVEGSSLIGSGACTLALGFPTMCNGANLCYEKRVFTEVDGFAGVDHLASGDDELLMHKIAARYPGSIQFLKHTDAIVSTGPHQSLGAFYQQRKRWASKWRAYSRWEPSVLAVFIFLSNTAGPLAVIGGLVGWFSGEVVAAVVLLKVLPEFWLLRQFLVFLQKKSSVGWIALTQILYPFYVIFFGLVAQGKGFEWKGRKLS